MPFDSSIERSEKIYLNKTTDRSNTSSTLDGLLEGFTDFADKFHQAAMSGDSIGAGKEIATAAQGVSDRIAGRTKGDRELEQSIQAGWNNMTSQQQAAYKAVNQRLETIAQNTPGWENYKGLTGFERYAAEVRLNKHVRDPMQRQNLGLNKQYNRPKPGDPEFTQYAKNQWDNRLTDAQRNHPLFQNQFTNYLDWLKQGK